ncbi:IS5 family transposase [Deinococcus sp. SM5_A1]|uniref:IS5 family transposase n=1 Tax=Deinococcus sp. SM5_A1 TaxID=3379094 RepID=UPI003859FF79
MQDATPEQWELIEPLLPPIGESTFRQTVPRRKVVNGIRYVLRSGIQWRMMPHDPPKWETVYFHHNLWSKTGVWKAINAALVKIGRDRKGRKAEPSAAVGDSQSVKTTHKKGIAAGTATKRSRAVSAIERRIRTATQQVAV